MSVAFVGLGSNLGDRAGHLRTALAAMQRHPSMSRLHISDFRRTDPMGGPEQPDYVNAAVCLETNLNPNALLRWLLDLEAREGRVRKVANGPRTLDLDLLLYGTHAQSSHDLELPHPRMTERRFVLEPLAQLAPRLPLIGGRTVEECLQNLA
ncbi:MAG: 2-amino-4-hydroxy-6-hydroxymethyldihydropteridine diphosphokinase [Planctomycetota bacterium]|nr:2-amino-4-hydroxy-6-hydroxymethyldihydropteridine diphosphokinase [Planctomycetota bacterium]MDA1113657.1 2-amino-4-hydroxy-6-hydroxymethyldihydropteridine diphosphokinase [Planctomycetota bacterium]